VFENRELRKTFAPEREREREREQESEKGSDRRMENIT
jgi:hypothetical protein